jgi:hypothetical protein
MSKENPTDDPRQHTDWKTTKPTSLETCRKGTEDRVTDQDLERSHKKNTK